MIALAQLPVVTPVRVALFLVATSGITAAQTTTLPAASAPSVSAPSLASPALTTAQADGIIYPSDVIEINVFNAVDLHERLRVRDNGTVHLPLVGDTQVAGMTTSEAEKVIEKELRDRGLVKEPVVSVLVAESPAFVTVVGAVMHPGNFPIRQARTVMDAILAAGGFTETASNSLTIQHAAEEPIKISWQSDDERISKLRQSLMPGDAVTVDKAQLAYVLGEVVQPSGIVINPSEPVTVLKAIAIAHGFTQKASLGKSRILRKQKNGSIQEIKIHLNNLMANKEPDIAMLPNDMLYVPSSKLKEAAQAVSYVAQTSAAALIVHAY